MKKQTAVEWLFAHLLPFLPFSDPKEREHFRRCLSEAKAMEKENMIGLLQWMNKIASETPMRLETDLDDIVEQYYNETYGGDK